VSETKIRPIKPAVLIYPGRCARFSASDESVVYCYFFQVKIIYFMMDRQTDL